MKLSELRTHQDVLTKQRRDPAFREEWDRATLARAVARRVIAYRAEKKLTQRELAQKLHISQPWVARLERGEHNPDLDTLMRLSISLRLEFVLEVRPSGHASHLRGNGKATVVEQFSAEGSKVLVKAY